MIDAHLHVVPPNLPGVGCLHPLCTEPPESVAAALREGMRAAGVTHAFAMGQWNGGPADPLGIHTTLAVCELVPGLRPIGVCDPTRGDDPDHLAKVEKELARKRVVALKCYLGYLHYEPAHPGYRRYYELAARFKVPVFFHSGDTYSAMAKLKYAHPLGIDEVAVEHPDARFVIAHCGNPWLTDAAEVVYKNLNVWADLSGLVVGDGGVFADPEAKDQLADLAAAVRRAFRYAERPNRFVFGTDWPLIPIAPYKQFVASIIPPTHHPDVFEDNARTLFRIAD
ncbi:MAG: amidohydrolase family protein [Gemmataceae bacterium]